MRTRGEMRRKDNIRGRTTRGALTTNAVIRGRTNAAEGVARIADASGTATATKNGPDRVRRARMEHIPRRRRRTRRRRKYV